MRAHADHNRRFARPAVAGAIAAVVLTAALLASGLVATAQDQSAATPKDAIFARKTLMDAVDEKIIAIEEASRSGRLDLDTARDQADTISVLLMAFPHLFPPATNQWKPDRELDPVTDTYASPEAWADFADFYRRAADASALALRMAHAASPGDLKDLTMQLRVACDVCHALYLETP